jgi:hypothetical protein
VGGAVAVVLYTDGATDVAPPHGLSEREFTDLVCEACQDAPSATLIADRVHLALSSILSIDERNDDIALLVLKLRSDTDTAAKASVEDAGESTPRPASRLLRAAASHAIGPRGTRSG